MLKFRKEKKNNKGFSLVELVIVVAILAILVGILAPQYIKYVEQSRQSADGTNMDNIVTAFKVAAADEGVALPDGTYTITIYKDGKTDTEIKGPASKDISALIAAINKTLDGGYAKVRIKSKNWSADLVTTIEVGKDFNEITDITYGPDDFAKFMGKSATTKTP